MKTRDLSILLLVIALLAGCRMPPVPQAPTSQPTETTQPADTSAPTETAVPSPTAQPTEEPEPTATPEPTEVARLPGNVVRSDVRREMTPDVSAEQVAARSENNNAFAFDLYRTLADREGNLFYSPYSISIALAMAYAGAEGETEQQMAETLHITLAEPTVHAAYNALDLAIMQRGEHAGEQSDSQGDAESDGKFQLNVANAIWGQAGYAFRAQYLDLLARHYGSGLRTLDFSGSPDAAREAINDWVSQETQGRIEDLISRGGITPLTRLVLANAIYFKAAWQHPFTEDRTEALPFTTLEGEEVLVPMMKQTLSIPYAGGEDYQAIELPYAGDGVSMVVVMPDAQSFEAFEGSLDVERLNDILGALEARDVALTMPRFEYDTSYQMVETLTALGMEDAFSPEVADFSGMDGTMELFIQNVVHKAFVSVDEEGTEAAAATGVVVGVTSAPQEPVQVALDHPFIFVIRDTQSGAILFVGRVLNPGGGSS